MKTTNQLEKRNSNWKTERLPMNEMATTKDNETRLTKSANHAKNTSNVFDLNQAKQSNWLLLHTHIGTIGICIDTANRCVKNSLNRTRQMNCALFMNAYFKMLSIALIPQLNCGNYQSL